MAKRVKDWTTQDVMVWLTKNMGRLNSAESLRVYVQMESITGQMMLGFNKNDSTRFGLIKANDFEKILKKLQSHDEKIAQNERKTIGKKKKKGFWQSDNKDSGLDESNSVCDDVQGPGFRDIHVNSDSPGSANTSGTGSFMSMSGGSTHKHHTPLVQSVNYESTPAPGRQTIPEATYVAPEDEEACAVRAAPAPSRPVPHPSLPDPDYGEEPEAMYENFGSPPPPPQQADDIDEWHDNEQTYLNLEDDQDEEPEDIYENQEAESSSSEESSSDDGGNQENLALADIQRRLTFAMAGMTDQKKAPSRPPVQPPASGTSPFVRRPVEPPNFTVPLEAKPETPSRDAISPSRNMPPGPPAPPEKPKPSFLNQVPTQRVSVAGSSPDRPPAPPFSRQKTSPSLPTSPAGEASGGKSIKERMAFLNNDKPSDYHIQSDAGSVSIKDKQAKLAGLFGGATQTTAPPLQPAPPVSRAISPPARPVPGILPPKIPPARPGADLPPPPPPLSCIPKSAPPAPAPAPASLSKGCYEDNEITFPPPPSQGRSPLLPPSNPPNFGSTVATGYNPAEEDDEGLYALEPDDLYNDEHEDIYNDGEEENIPGYVYNVSSRQKAEEILRNDPKPECFLVRDSTNNPLQYPYVISIKAQGNSFEHTRLGTRSSGRLAIGTTKPGEQTHASLLELIRYHMTSPLNLRGRNVILRYPVAQSQ